MVARLNRPAQRNALNLAICEAMTAALRDATAEESVAVVLLTSADPACFSAGMDTKEAVSPGAGTIDALLTLQWACETFPKPLIAALGGYVIGGGAELALSADVRVGSPTTTFRFPGTAFGLVQGSWHLIDEIGRAAARELVLTGRAAPADECMRLGLLHEVSPEPEPRARELAHELARRDERAMRESKRLIMTAGGRPQRERFDEEHRINAQMLRHSALRSMPMGTVTTKEQT